MNSRSNCETVQPRALAAASRRAFSETETLTRMNSSRGSIGAMLHSLPSHPMTKKDPSQPRLTKAERQALAKRKADAAAVYVEPGAHHFLHGFKRDHLVKLVKQASAERVTKAEAAAWAKEPRSAPAWLKSEWDRRAVAQAIATANDRARQDRLLAKVVARLQRGALSFKNPEAELLVADIAFRAWKDIQRGGSASPLEVAAMKAAGINA